MGGEVMSDERRNRSVIRADGSDAIFITGAPGSKWSLVAYAVSLADGVNTSDAAETRTYGSDAGGPVHFGNYFGPGMEYGQRFDTLDRLTKPELMEELSRPYASADGIKILKSHMFGRHLDHLVPMFPEARFVLVHRPDEECLDWWLEAGGFEISFPDYSWYRELSNMKAQIARDNEAITGFAERHGLRLTRPRSFKPLLGALGLTFAPDRLQMLVGEGADSPFGVTASDPEEIERALHERAREARLAYFRGSEVESAVEAGARTA